MWLLLIPGFGTGVILLINGVVVQYYFHRRRSIAFAIAQSGNSAGGLISGPLIRASLDTFGFKGHFLFLSGLYLQNVIVGSLYRPPQTSEKVISVDPGCVQHESESLSLNVNAAEACSLEEENSTLPQVTKVSKLNSWFRDTLDFSILRDPRAVLVYCGLFLVSSGFFMAVANVVGRAVHIGIEPKKAALLPTCLNAFSFVGRLISGVIGDRLPHRCLQMAVYGLVAAAFGMCVVFTTTFWSMAIVHSTFGMFNCELSCLSRYMFPLACVVISNGLSDVNWSCILV